MQQVPIVTQHFLGGGLLILQDVLCIRFLWFYASIAGPINMPNCFVGPPSTSSSSPDHYWDPKNCCTNKIKSLQDHHGTHYLNLQDKLCCLSGKHYYDNCWANEWDGRITERFLLEVTLTRQEEATRSLAGFLRTGPQRGPSQLWCSRNGQLPSSYSN